MGSFITAQAQDSCDTAIEITENGLYAFDAIDGENEAGQGAGRCWQTGAAAAEWFMFTAAENGTLRINTNLEQNNIPNDPEDDSTLLDDTRINVYTGECSDLICYDGTDDISATNYLSDLTTEVQAGTTYYIAFDNRWSDLGFDFEITFTGGTCFSPAGFTFVEEPTTTTATIGWTPPTIGTPVGYEFEYGVEGFTQGTGILLTLDDVEAAMDNLTPGTTYAFYIRTNCGEGDYSTWTGPVTFSTLFDAASLNYAYGFESMIGGGWTAPTATLGSSWTIAESDPTVPGFEPQEGALFATVGANGDESDSWLFSRGLNLTANDVVTISYYVKKIVFEGNGNSNTLAVNIGNQAAAGSQNPIRLIDDVTDLDYTMYTDTYTVPTTGVYYLGFNYVAPGHDADDFGRLLLDNVTVTSSFAGVNNALASQFSVFPNPASNVVKVSNANALVNNVTITDVNGRTVKTAKFEGVSEAEVNVSDLSAGVYMMTISSDKGTTTKKIIKN